MWVFPTPGFPTSSTFSARSRKPRDDSPITVGLWTLGWNPKSKSSRVFT